MSVEPTLSTSLGLLHQLLIYHDDRWAFGVTSRHAKSLVQGSLQFAPDALCASFDIMIDRTARWEFARQGSALAAARGGQKVALTKAG